MSPDERTEAEVRADRALRRGELSTALQLYQAIAAAFPKDDVVQLKLRRIKENLQPMELTHAKTRVPLDERPSPTNTIESAEALAATGDYAGAIALYRRALQKRPDSDLIKERLAELFEIVQAMAPRESSPRPPPPALREPPKTAAPPPPPAPLSPARPAPAPKTAAPLPLPPAPVPPAPPAPPSKPAVAEAPTPPPPARLLSDLLDQISRRRRDRPSGG